MEYDQFYKKQLCKGGRAGTFSQIGHESDFLNITMSNVPLEWSTELKFNILL